MQNIVKPIQYFTYLGLDRISKIIIDFVDNDDSLNTWDVLVEYKEELTTQLEDCPEEDTIEILDFILNIKKLGNHTSNALTQSICDSEACDGDESELHVSLRKYYCTVMGCDLFTYSEKFDIIYLDLVIPQLNHFNCTENMDGFKVLFSYNTPFVKETTNKMITCGRLPCNVIKTNTNNNTVSRCNFIMLKIKNEFIILSGWSIYGTECLMRENTDKASYNFDDGRDQHNYLMRFDENETFVIGIGSRDCHEKITFNPKMCVICMENKCEVRGSCNHATMCETCFQEYKTINNGEVKCPVCRTVYTNEVYSMCAITYKSKITST
tara:strand:- start:3046 stop:4017 length:972 start_codon:yes stop_codon:yes gene_type:complete